MKRILALIIILVVAAGCSSKSEKPDPTPEPTPTASVSAEPIRILRLDSYHAEFPWSDEITRGVIQGLTDSGFNIEDDQIIFDVYFMDTKRNTSEEYFTEISEQTIAYIRETQPDIVIGSDDNVARLVAQPMRTEGIPFVLVGINGTPEQYEFDSTTYVAGVLERPHTQQMMDWITRIFGDGARLAILAEDSLTSERMFGDGSIEEGVRASSVELVDITYTSDFTVWQDYVTAVPESADVLFLGAYATLRDADGNAVEPLDALQWTLDNSQIPVMGFWEEAVHTGTLGGPIISGYTQGYEAALRAAKILEGAPPSEIGFSVPPRGKLMLNQQAMERWNVTIPISILEVSEIAEQ